MNGTLISEDKLLKLKNLAKKINELEFFIITGKRDDDTLLRHRILTQQLTELILEL